MVNIKKGTFTKEEISELEIKKEDRHFLTFKFNNGNFEIKFLGKSLQFKWWF